MTLQTFVDQIKRDCRVGSVGTNTDQTATDIIAKLNRVRFRIWRAWDWEWSIVPIEFTLGAGEKDKTLDSAVGSIIILGIQDTTGYLRKFTYKRYRQWEKKRKIDEEKSIVIGYLRRGRDSSGNLKLRFVHTPASATVIEGEGKKRITAYTTGDISTVTTMEFFPEEVQDILFDAVKGLTWEQSGDDRGASTISRSEFMLKELISDEESDPADEITSPPPDFLIWANRTRGGTTVV